MRLFRKLRDRLLPADLRRSFTAVDSWGQQDWEGVVSTLEPHLATASPPAGDILLLGVAHTRLGHLEQALFYFEQLDPDALVTGLQEPVYTTSYAYLLARAGREEEACELLRSNPCRLWLPYHRGWADEFLAAPDSRESPPAVHLDRTVQ